jgi:DNA-binding LacI/PurR family transcriptional regulator
LPELSLSVGLIVERLEERIRTGEYRRGQWLPTERALAEEFDVSRATLRLALSELERRELILRARGSRPIVKPEPRSHAAASAATGRRSIAVCITGDPTDVADVLTVRGIQQELDQAAYRLVFASPVGPTIRDCIRSERQLLRHLASDSDIAGAILWYLGGEENARALQQFAETRIPMVFVDREPPVGIFGDFVGVDNRQAVRELVGHLVARGHRRVAYVTNLDNASTVHEREEGYRRGLIDYGIEFEPRLLLVADAPPNDVPSVAARLKSMDNRPSAVCVVNDHTALMLVEALKREGLRVPEDIAVAGFDDAERWKLGAPFLTTVRQPFQRMGEEAVRLLLARLNSGPGPIYRYVRLEPTLVVRASTGGSDAPDYAVHEAGRGAQFRFR